MTSLTGKPPKDTYKDLLQVSNGNAGVDGALRPVSDGEGTDSALSLSTAAAQIKGPLDFAGTDHAGVRLNNLTTAQRNALTPAAGATIFNVTTGQQETYTGTAWASSTGLPPGGTAGQVLRKKTNADNDVEWASLTTSALARIPGGTNTFLPTTNQIATNAVQVSYTRHFCPAGGGLPRGSFANWQTGNTGEQLSPPNMVGWNHFALIDTGDALHPVTFNGRPSGFTDVGQFVLSDAHPAARVQGGTWFGVLHVAVAANYRSGAGAPPASLGANGDTYYDEVANVYYQKASGSWGSSSATNPWLSAGYVVPVSHYTRGAFGEYHAQLKAVRTYQDGSFPHGALFKNPDVSSGTLTFSQIAVRTPGKGYTWDGVNYGLDILDLSQKGPGGGKGTPAAGYANFQAGAVTTLTPTTATGTTYTGPLAVGLGGTNAAWGPSGISIVPDAATPWLMLKGDSITAGVGSADGDGDQYRQFGIYQRLFAALGLPTVPTLNWGVNGLTAQALVGNMAQARAMFAALFPGGGSNVLIAAGTNDYLGGSGLSSVKASIQAEMNYSKNTQGFTRGGVATILPRTTSTDSWATEANQTPVNAAFNTGGDVLTHNSQVVAGTFLTNQDFYVDLRGYVQGANPLVWKTAAPFTASANSSTYAPTGDGIHPSKYLCVLASQNNLPPAVL